MGVGLLTAKGTPERSARTMIGKWKRDYGGDLVAEILLGAMTNNPTAPIPYITKALQNTSVNLTGGVDSRLLA